MAIEKPAYNPQTHRRQSIRLWGYDYSRAGVYFVTICSHDRECLFGEIAEGGMKLNLAGLVANECWLKIPEHFSDVILHEYIVMPNHVHGIIELVTNDATTVGANKHSPNPLTDDHRMIEGNDTTLIDGGVGANKHSPNPLTDDHRMIEGNDTTLIDGGVNPVFNSEAIGDGKRANIYSPLPSSFRSPSRTIGSIIRGFKIGVVKECRLNTDVHMVWQRNYYEHIIRNEASYQMIADYIINNPANWEADRFFKT